MSEAYIWMQQAKSEAKMGKNPAWKIRADKLDKKIEKYYQPFFQKVESANLLKRNDKYKSAIEQLEEAKEIIVGSLAIDLSEARELDNQLVDGIHTNLAKTDTARMEHYTELINNGQRLIQFNDPAGALNMFEAARDQMFQERGEWEHNRIDYYIAKAKYKELLQEGDRFYMRNEFEDAYEIYKQAQKTSPESIDVDNRIRKVENDLYRTYIRDGDQAFSSRDYEASSAAYKKAKQFKPDGPEAEQRVKKHYETFKNSGDRFLNQERYEDAKTNFEWAQLFFDSDEIRVKIDQTEHSLAYSKNYEKGLEYIKTDDIDGAKRSFEKAARHAQTEEVQEQLNFIRNYNEHIRSGKRLMKKNPEEAMNHFRSAKALFSTSEVEKLMAKAKSESDSSGSSSNGLFSRRGR